MGNDGVMGACGGMSWRSILAGAVGAIAISLILTFLGSALGLASVSPWSGSGASAGAFTLGMAVWLVVMQWLSAGFGGYLAGRLRGRVEGMNGDEVYFRDSAHGFLTWAVATLLTAAFLTTAVASAAGVGAKAAAMGAGAAGAVASRNMDNSGGANAYYWDGLFRSDKVDTASGGNEQMRGETMRIFARGAQDGGINAEDKNYLAHQIAVRTGVTEGEARARIERTETQLREKADAARKTGIMVSFMTVLTMLLGGFIAAVAGIIGGRDRDEF